MLSVGATTTAKIRLTAGRTAPSANVLRTPDAEMIVSAVARVAESGAAGVLLPRGLGRSRQRPKRRWANRHDAAEHYPLH